MTPSEHGLERLPLFAELSGPMREELLEAGVMRTVQVGEVLLWEGRDTEGILYFLLSGEFQVSKLSPQGKETILRLISAAETFGLAALFDDPVSPATLTVTQQGKVMVIPASQFLELLRKDFQLTLRILKLLSSRLREAYEQLQLVASTKARSRLARIIQFHAERGGLDPQDGGWRLRIPLSYSILSRIAGISYDETIRILQEWTDVLDYRRGEILLKDLDGLQAIADQD